MLIEESKALGAKILFFPKGKLDAGLVACTSLYMPDPNDPGWIDFQRIEKWAGKREDEANVKLYDSSTGRRQLASELELGGDLTYTFTTNVLLAYVIGLFFRSANPLLPAGGQFNPDQKSAPEGWLIIENRDQEGVLIIGGNLWGKMKLANGLSGGAGEATKPDLTFMMFKNDLNTLSI